MSLIKFDHTSLPSYVREEILYDAPDPEPDVIGWFATTPTGDVQITDGDYLIENNGILSEVVLRVDYLASVEREQFIRGFISKDLNRSVVEALVALSLTNQQKINLYTYITPVTTLIIGESFSEARLVANALATTTEYTTGRKNALLAIIDEAITKL